MLRRVSGADRAAALGVLLGVIACFVPWYSYTTASTHVAVNGFRASFVGDVFFVAVAATALLLLMRHSVIEDLVGPRIDERQALTVLAGVAAGSVLIQLVLDAAGGGRSISVGFLLALLSAIAIGVAAWVQRPGTEARFTVRQMLGEDLPD